MVSKTNTIAIKVMQYSKPKNLNCDELYKTSPTKKIGMSSKKLLKIIKQRTPKRIVKIQGKAQTEIVRNITAKILQIMET